MTSRYQFGPFEVVPDLRQVLAHGAELPLGGKAFDLLVCLLRHAGRVMPKNELLALVWPGLVVEENNLSVQIVALRKQLGFDAIMTVTGHGFRLGFVALEVPDAAARLKAANVSAAVSVPILALPHKPSIVVLPFVNMDDEAGHDHFVDGLTEDITTELARFHNLFVISRHSAFSYKGKLVDVRAIARELGVHYLLEGSVRSTGSRIRVTAQLIDATSGNHVWAERYDRELGDIFEVQEEVTRAIVAALEPQIRLSDYQRVRSVRPANLNAYGLALRGSAILYTDYSVASCDAALQLAQEALALDASLGLAWRTVASVWFLRIGHSGLVAAGQTAQAIQYGLHAAEQAIQLDAADHRALNIKGRLLCMAHQPEDGLAALRRAHDMNPNDAYNLCWLGYYEGTCGNSSLAVAYTLLGLRLSPLDPLRSSFLFLASGTYISLGNYAQALQYVQEANRLRADVPTQYTTLAICHVGLRQYDLAHAAFAAAKRLSPELVQTRLAGHWPMSSGTLYYQRVHAFFRIAAGLEPSSTADGLR